jgi:hypothetical protein
VSGTDGGHWFDRLAERQSRRQVLKAAVAGVALTLPFVRAQTAAAAKPSCSTGCIWTNHARFDAQIRACNTASNYGLSSAVFLTFWLAAPAQAVAGVLVEGVKQVACQDQALLQQKAGAADCAAPGCPGFDPHGPHGPCVDCDNARGGKGFACCPSSRNLTGYVCCVCCDTDSHDGCKALCP